MLEQLLNSERLQNLLNSQNHKTNDIDWSIFNPQELEIIKNVVFRVKYEPKTYFELYELLNNKETQLD